MKTKKIFFSIAIIACFAFASSSLIDFNDTTNVQEIDKTKVKKRI